MNPDDIMKTLVLHDPPSYSVVLILYRDGSVSWRSFTPPPLEDSSFLPGVRIDT